MGGVATNDGADPSSDQRTSTIVSRILVAAALLLASCSSSGSPDAAPVAEPSAPASSPSPAASPDARIAPEFPTAIPVEREPVVLEGLTIPTAPGRHELAMTTVEESGRRTERRALLFVPEGNEPFPVLFAFHPLGGDADSMDRFTAIGTVGARRGAVVVMPNGIGRSWNASDFCCPPATDEEQADVAFVVALDEAVRDALPTTDERSAATGFSNGGFLSYRLACDAADVFGRIAPVAGTMDLPCAPVEPVSVLHVHGAADFVVPVEGRADFVSPQAESSGARHVVEAWARLNGCGIAPDGDRMVWPDCPDGVDVELRILDGVGHEWPPVGEGTEAVLDFLLGPEQP